MKIGIISEGHGDGSLGLLTDCDEIIVLEAEKIKTNNFYEIVVNHLEDELTIPSVAAVGLQLVQLLPSFKVLANKNKIIHFIQKDQSNLMSAQAFFDELYYLALVEETVIKKRTGMSIRKAQARGVSVGRPKINAEMIKRIRYLHEIEKKTIREIAAICQVSVGTAFKYSKAENEIKFKRKKRKDDPS